MTDASALVRTTVTAATLFLGLGGCAPAISTPRDAPPAPEPLTEAGIEVAARLLALEDRREYDAESLDSAAASPEPGVRRLAVLAAARLGAPEARPLVRHLLRDRDTAVVASAAFAAGLLRDTAAVPALVGLLGREELPSPSVALEAADALGRIATDEARAALVERLLDADTADANIGPAVGSALIAAWRAGATTAEPFSRWLRSRDPELRWRAVYALTRGRVAGAARRVLPALSDPNPYARAFALRGVHADLSREAGLAPGEVLPLVVPLLEDSVYSVRVEAIRALASFGPGAEFGRVVRIASNGETHERAAAIEAIGQLGATAAVAAPELRRIAVDSTTHVFLRALSVGAAAAVDPDGALAWLSTVVADPEWRVRAAVGRAVAALDEVAPGDLEPFLRDFDPRVAAATVAELVAWESVDRLRPFRGMLLGALDAGDVHVRAAALEAFQELADPTVFPTFLDVYQRSLDDTQNDAQLAAIDAIARLREAGVPAPERVFFTRFDPSGDYLVRRRALLRFGPAATAAWGESSPIETGATPQTYLEHVRRWIAPARLGSNRPRVRIETTMGDVEVVLHADVAPLTVANFLLLARAGFFDGQEWPRVVPNFVVQGGDPRGDTSGGPGYSIRDEINRSRYELGSVGMALSGPDTGGSQFFITHAPQPHLDGTYTLFGEIAAGQDVLETILPGDRIVRVTEITEEL